jgi:hypothetical protein
MNSSYISNKLNRTTEFLKHFNSHYTFSVSLLHSRVLATYLKWNGVYGVGCGAYYRISEIYISNKIHSIRSIYMHNYIINKDFNSCEVRWLSQYKGNLLLGLDILIFLCYIIITNYEWSSAEKPSYEVTTTISFLEETPLPELKFV